MRKGDLYESSDGDIYEITKVDSGDVIVKVVKESETRKPDTLGTERTWFLVDFEEMITDGDVWKVSQIPVRVKDLVEQWKALNKRHNEINHWYNEVYGGPDVSERNFAERDPSIAAKSRVLAGELDGIMTAKIGLENKMTDEEFEQTLNQRSLEGKTKSNL